MFDRKFWILICSAILAGLIIGWIDTRPNWDDTGITVGLVVLSTPWKLSIIGGHWDSSVHVLLGGSFKKSILVS